MKNKMNIHIVQVYHSTFDGDSISLERFFSTREKAEDFEKKILNILLELIVKFRTFHAVMNQWIKKNHNMYTQCSDYYTEYNKHNDSIFPLLSPLEQQIRYAHEVDKKE
jgi:uncharacterized repeat protein (TIGR04076 family)